MGPHQHSIDTIRRDVALMIAEMHANMMVEDDQ